MSNIFNKENNSSPVGSMLTTAIVTNNNDPDELGRIKVQYPWSDDESYWARIATLMAGDNSGSYFIPEVDEEVLVAFVNGDIQSPIVIGSLWNQSDVPPGNNSDGENNIRKIRSRNGHEIVFDDSERGEKIEINSSGGHKIIFDDTAGDQTIKIEDSSGNGILMEANKITLKSNMELSIEAPVIDIKADNLLTLQGALIRIN